MLKSLIIILLAAIPLLEYGCLEDTDQSQQHYVKYFSDKEKAFKPVLTNGHFRMEVSYRPAELLALMESPGISDSALQKIKNENKNSAFFVCRIYHDSLTIIDYLKKYYEEKYDSVWNRILFNIQSSFFIQTDGKKIPCSIYQVEQTGNVSPALTFDLTFETKTSEIADDWEFNYSDSLIGNTNWRVVFDKNDLNKIPKLKIHK